MSIENHIRLLWNAAPMQMKALKQDILEMRESANVSLINAIPDEIVRQSQGKVQAFQSVIEKLETGEPS